MCVQLRKMTRFEYVTLLHGHEAAVQSREMERVRREQLERERARLTSGELLRLLLRRALSAKRRELSDRMLSFSSGEPLLPLFQHFEHTRVPTLIYRSGNLIYRCLYLY